MEEQHSFDIRKAVRNRTDEFVQMIIDKISGHRIKNILCLLAFVLMCALLSSCVEDQYEYTTDSYTINNNLNECYRVDYTEKSGFPDHSVEIVISDGNDTIIDYTTKYKLQFLPTSIVYLFDDDRNEYYYIANEVSSSIVVKMNGTTDYTIVDDVFELDIDFTDTSKEYISDYYLLASKMRKSLKEQDITEKFQTCGYDYSRVLQVYFLK